MSYRRRSRFDGTVQLDHEPSPAALMFVERRVGGFVEAFNFHQTFSATVGVRNRPTLLDVVVSAYLQGLNDTVEMYARNGIELPPNAADAFAATKEKA